MPEAHVLSVFCGDGAVGNPTGVIETDAEPDDGAAQALAARLGLPDTAFTWVDADGTRHVRFFSPSEPLAACYQALLGAAAALGPERTAFVLRDRTLEVTRADDRFWVRTPHALIRAEARHDTPFGPGGVVDVGRRRVYVRLDAEPFDAARWDPEAASSWLRGAGLSGVCLVHEPDPATIRLRVFTTSLGGREDVATGGAVAGLPAAGFGGARLVRQGLGAPLRRGELVVRADGEDVWVGGRVEALVRGTLTAPLV